MVSSFYVVLSFTKDLSKLDLYTRSSIDKTQTSIFFLSFLPELFYLFLIDHLVVSRLRSFSLTLSVRLPSFNLHYFFLILLKFYFVVLILEVTLFFFSSTVSSYIVKCPDLLYNLLHQILIPPIYL